MICHHLSSTDNIRLELNETLQELVIAVQEKSFSNERVSVDTALFRATVRHGVTALAVRSVEESRQY